jgi:hypothetical protein
VILRALLVVCVLHASAIACAEVIHYVEPAPRTVDVPLNAKLWLFDGPHGPLRLRAADGSDRPLLQIQYDDWVIRAELGALRPGTTYEVLEDGKVLTTFMTGDAFDREPPGPPDDVEDDVTDDLYEHEPARFMYTLDEPDESSCIYMRAFDLAGNVSAPTCIPTVKPLEPRHVSGRDLATALALAVLAMLALAFGRAVRPTS